MIPLTLNEKARRNNLTRCREKKIVIPTFAQMKNPGRIPTAIHHQLKEVGLWDVNPLNLFRITWKNEPKESGGLYGGVNVLELPTSLTGVRARIVALVGKWFPTGAHKVGATFGCLAPALVTGAFDSTWQKAVWPSTGNFCRGGAFNSALLGCESVAILPEGMSRERFEWLRRLAGEVIATPGSESNVKEIFDKCWELKATRKDVRIFNQFEEFGNYLWHYEVTGNAIGEMFDQLRRQDSKLNLSAFVSSTGSAGTIASGDFLKQRYPGVKIGAAEALQCPTLLENGFGSHRIEGIGDKHVPWIHNVRNTDVVIDVDDNDCIRLLRLFNEGVGKEYLVKAGVDAATVSKLDLLGISGIGNVLASIKLAKYFELGEHDVVVTVLTDSMQLYGSRLKELDAQFGAYADRDAVRDFHASCLGADTSTMLELRHTDRRRIHNLKYFTWIEQQKRDIRELNAQWYDPEYWIAVQRLTPQIDNLIEVFNDELLKSS